MTDQINLQKGSTAVFYYKSGKYIGEVLEINEGRVLVQTLAVLKHPAQGDLHNPGMADVPFFHQRRALAYTEKRWLPDNVVFPFNEGEVPNYKDSLLVSVEQAIESLSEKKTPWADRSILELKILTEEYERL